MNKMLIATFSLFIDHIFYTLLCAALCIFMSDKVIFAEC